MTAAVAADAVSLRAANAAIAIIITTAAAVILITEADMAA